ncbi:MAG TPA: pyridoxal phosphate-dependent aminotransferase [Bryobacteraceae bacterium]|nr:pyridoxal phosphate-dependent aminotransferase [Bryobacteraceae bacterium]
MFSSRLDWTVAANPISKLLDARRAAGAPILDLTESNPTAAGLSYPAEAILAALADHAALHYEPASAGMPAARSAISAYYGGCVDPERILLTASTSEGYAFLFKLLCNPGDEVLTPRPSYPLFEFLASLESVRSVQYPLVYDGSWRIDFDALRGRITQRTRAVVLVNPNNPTGSFVKRAELAQLIDLCRDRQLAIVSDEVFSDYGVGDDPRRVRSLVDVTDVLTFSLSGLSKVAGLPQMKLGWIVISGPAAARQQAFHRLELIGDTYLSVGAPVQCAAASMLAVRLEIQNQIHSRVAGNLEFLRNQIGPQSPWRVLDLEGGWYATLQAPRIHTEEEWTLTLLAEENVLVQPGFFFDFDREAFLVVSLLTKPETLREGVRRILAHA